LFGMFVSNWIVLDSGNDILKYGDKGTWGNKFLEPLTVDNLQL